MYINRGSSIYLHSLKNLSLSRFTVINIINFRLGYSLLIQHFYIIIMISPVPEQN
jgi:hypothetical protein